jgi:hypothetical protein
MLLAGDLNLKNGKTSSACWLAITELVSIWPGGHSSVNKLATPALLKSDSAIRIHSINASTACHTLG